MRIVWVCFFAVYGFGIAAHNLPGLFSPEISLTEITARADYSGFYTNDLLQGLYSVPGGGLNPLGTYVRTKAASDAASPENPGTSSEIMVLNWPEFPQYLVYSFPSQCRIDRIIITAVFSTGREPPVFPDNTSGGNIALGIKEKSNPLRLPPVRPEENAVEVTLSGIGRFIPALENTIESGWRTDQQGTWRLTIDFNNLQPVTGIKFALGMVQPYKNPDTQLAMRVSEIDILGKPVKAADRGTKLVPVNVNNAVFSGLPVSDISTRPDDFQMLWPGTGFTVRSTSRTVRLHFRYATGSIYGVRFNRGRWKYFSPEGIVDISPDTSVSADAAQKEKVYEMTVMRISDPFSGSDVCAGLEINRDAEIFPVNSGRGSVMLNPAYQKKVLILGDSVAAGLGAGTNEAVSDYTFSWPYLLGELINADIRTLAVCGMGAVRGSHPMTLYEELEQMLADFYRSENKIGDRFLPDVILVQIGINDYYAKVPKISFQAALLQLGSLLSARFPKSELILMTPWAFPCYQKEIQNAADILAAQGAGVRAVNDITRRPFSIFSFFRIVHPGRKLHERAAQRIAEMLGEEWD